MKRYNGNNRPCPTILLWSVAALFAVTSAASGQDVERKTDPYKVVINHEEQYSIWPADREVRRPWRETGETCSLKGCTAYIEEVWTDMRPLSLRKKMDGVKLEQDANAYKVVINHEEQYSIWLADQAVRRPWRETGETCSLKGCMAYIEEVWTDMRPLSLRKKP